MSAVWMRVRAELRGHLRGALVIGILLGLSGGVVLAAAIGARRTQTAYPRLLRDTRAVDALIGLFVPPKPADAFFRAVAALPQVAEFGPLPGIRVFRVDASGRIDFSMKALVPTDDQAFRRFGRDTFLSGRAPAPDRADEVELNRPLAELLGAHVGDTLRGFRAFPGAVDPRTLKADQGSPVTLKVVGIGIAPFEILADAHTPFAAKMVLSPAFYRAHPEAVDFPFAVVRLHRGELDVPAFRIGVDAIASRFPGAPAVFSDQHDGEVRAARAIRPLAVTLALFSLLAGVGALLSVGQAFSREVARDAADYPTLHGIGMTRRQIFALSIIRASLIGVIGGVIAVGIAVATSGLLPFGAARIAEPHRGFALNVAWLAAGFGCIVVGMVVIASIPAAIYSRRTAAGAVEADVVQQRRLRAGGRLAGAKMPIAPLVGLRLLRPGRGYADVPVRSAIAGSMIAIAAVVLVVTFGTNLNVLVATPRLYGQDWDVTLDSSTFPIPTEPARAILRSDDDVAAFSGGNFGVVGIGSSTVGALGVEVGPGLPYPTLVRGRAASAPDEIVVGSRVLRRVHRDIGDTVSVEIGARARSLRIVGESVFPKFALGGFLRPELGDGVVVLPSLLAPPAPPGAAGGDIFTFMLVRFHAGVDHTQAIRRLAARTAQFGPCPFGPCIVAQQRPDDVTALSQVQAVPVLLALMLAVLAIVTLAHTLVTLTRRRRRDIAVLMAIGLTRVQVSAAIGWQGTLMAAAAVVVGVPVGIVLGRVAWRLFADLLGIPVDITIPILALVLTVPAAIGIARMMAVVPARLAARVRPAIALHAE